MMEVDATEKLYGDFVLTATIPAAKFPAPAGETRSTNSPMR